MKRYALIVGRRAEPDTIARYLPSNYAVIWTGTYDAGFGVEPAVVLSGSDDHGWTLHSYVIPRLGSGMIGATEIDLSHPIMKLIPEEG
jgi:hypothetical protein